MQKHFMRLGLKSLARIKKNLSLEKSVLDKGMIKANEMFSGNFSMYITYLIHQDCKDIKINKNFEENIQDRIKDKEALSEIDNILDIDI